MIALNAAGFSYTFTLTSMKNKEIINRIIELIKPHSGRVGLSIVSMLVVSGLSAGQAYMVKPLLDEIFFEKNSVMLNILPPALIFLFVVKGVFYYTYSYLLENVGQSIIRDLRVRLYRHVQSMPLSFFSRTSTGELSSRILGDVSMVQNAVSSSLIGIVKEFFQVFGLVGVIFYQNWELALLSMIFLPMAILPIYNFGRKYRKLGTSNQQNMARVSSHLHETISGSRIVKAFCTEEYESTRFTEHVKTLFRITMKDVQIRSLAHPLMEVLGGLGIALIIWYGGREVLNGTATPGTFFSFLTALIMIYEPIKKISRMNNPIQIGLAAADRVFTLLDVQPDIVDRPDAIELPLIQEKIEFRNIGFSYDKDRKVLDGLNLNVRAGEVVALVGPSGGGKTTIANLIPRFFDVTTGEIAIDGTDIRDVTMKSLRRQIGIVTQQTILFNDTVRNNIAYGDEERSMDDIIAAARAAHAYDFIMGLPDLFDTVIGESGSRLSGGQQQRLAIARALLKDAPILILDEATSALDTESERVVQRALENLMKGRTTVVIAHRLSTIKNADRIVVVQDGRIVEEGDHETLLANSGVYKNLHAMQFAT